MGLLFSTAETARLCERLNRKFNDDKIDSIRGNPRRLRKFTDPNRRLSRIAYKSGTYPGGSTTDSVAKRWFYFLQHLDQAIATQIKAQLKEGLTEKLANDDYKYMSLCFVAYLGPVQKFAYEDLEQVDATGAGTDYFVKIFKLQTPLIGVDVYEPVAPDPGEQPNEPDDPTP